MRIELICNEHKIEACWGAEGSCVRGVVRWFPRAPSRKCAAASGHWSVQQAELNFFMAPKFAKLAPGKLLETTPRFRAA